MRFYFWSFLILALVFLAHTIGVNGNLYLKLTGYDVVVHILGGIGIALALRAFTLLHGKSVRYPKTFIILGTLLAGLIWEGFEVYFDIAGHPYGTALYFQDTIKDLVDDVIGSVIVAVGTLKARSPQNDIHE